jgi:hypothetical protein
MQNKIIVKNVAVLAAFLLVTHLSRGQSSDPTVEIATDHAALINIGTNADNVTMAGENKAAKNVVEQEKPVFWNWYSEFGYESEYIFRGTNMTPGSDGDLFLDLEVSKWGFTLGATDIYQLGTARAPSFSVGEGGGGGTFGADSAVGKFFPETVQKFFNEIDLFQQYHHDFGPVDVTVGNIAFFIHREAQTFLTTQRENQFFGPSNPFPTVQNEQFDRVFVRLATSVIPHIQPWITYYQTLLSEGEDHKVYFNPAGAHYGSLPENYQKNVLHLPPDEIRPQNDNYHERNDELGGYLEMRLRGNFPVGEWFDINPFWVISYSYHDRSEPVNVLADSDPTRDFKDTLRGRSLVGWNHTQVGLELPIHILHFAGSSSAEWAPPDVRVNLVPFGDYSYHISMPTAGTDRNEWWGGVKVAVTF